MFDEAKADRAVKFIRNLRHTKGEWAGHPFNLMPWEEKIIRDLFGTIREDGSRQYREAYISVARKNGKSELAGAIANYCLFADGEQGAEVYTCAADRDQASLVFNASKTMVEGNQTLYANSKILDSVKRIVFDKKNSFYRALSSESYTKHGYNPSACINDELHVWPNRDLYDVMKTGMGARHQPLIINITTAGFDRNSLCWEIYQYAKKVRDGLVDDPTFYTAIWELDEKDDWKEEANWYKANPGLGIYRELDEMRDASKRALEIPAFENTFKRLYLNMWTEQETRFIPMDKWDECSGAVDIGSLNGRPCYIGLDLSSTTDVTALVMLFQGEDGFIDIVPKFYIPEESMKQRSDRDRVDYRTWVSQGFMTATPGNVIDYKYILEDVKQAGAVYDIKELIYDRWGATKLATDLQDEGVNIVPMGQGFASMSAPTKELLKVILAKKLRHGGNPVLRWMANNMVVRQDPAGNLKPDKEKSTEKIDGIVALIMALDGAIRNGMGTSVYDTRGILYLEPLEEETKEEPQETETIAVSEAKCGRCGMPINGEFCDNCGTRKLTNETTLHA